MPQITLATPADLPALCSLLEILFSQEAEFSPDPARQQAGLQQILQQPERGQILVARQDGQVVGMVLLLYSLSTALGAPVALLEDMVVDPRNRNGGTGSALLEAAIAQARQAGCRRITLLTDQDNLDAQRFYQRQGFVGSSMLPMRLML